jgi:hypothetical protein
VIGSPTTRAITAEASTTISVSFTRRLGAAFVDQFLHQIAALRHISCDDSLRFPDRLLPGAQPQFAFADRLDQQFVARLQAGCGPAFRRDHNPALRIDRTRAIMTRSVKCDTRLHISARSACVNFPGAVPSAAKEMPAERKGCNGVEPMRKLG